ncbi:MAG TPA: hypothetical protein PKI14_18950 [Fervidobacterium sp.]|nr:hypothetical protein [Fervidobacterium sp.]
MINEMPKIYKEIKFTMDEFKESLNIIKLSGMGDMYAHALRYYDDGTIAYFGEFYPTETFMKKHNSPMHFTCDLQIEYCSGVEVKPEEIQHALDALKYRWLWLRIYRVYDRGTVRRWGQNVTTFTEI